MKTAINVEDVSFAYKTLKVLEDVNFSISQGSFIGIIGPNGGGKTTLLKLLMGFYFPLKGKIHLLENSPEKMRLHVGYVPQVNTCDPTFPITVKELVLLGCVSQHKLLEGYSKNAYNKAMSALETMGLISYKDIAFGELSGGLAQRALIARALASDPSFLFLDEAISNVDTKTKEEILQVMNTMKGKKTILMVTHDLNTVIEYVDSVLSVEKKITTYLPEQICEHFTKGLYHTPLVKGKTDEPL